MLVVIVLGLEGHISTSAWVNVLPKSSALCRLLCRPETGNKMEWEFLGAAFNGGQFWKLQVFFFFFFLLWASNGPLPFINGS